MTDYLDQSIVSTPKKRPVFLTVLCILTFVSCGLGIISSSFSMLAGNVLHNQRQANEDAIRMIKQQGGNQQGIKYMTSSIKASEKIQKLNTPLQSLGLGNAILCLGGALLMWKCRKVGFYIYVTGQILPLISLYILYDAIHNIPVMGAVAIIGAIVSAFFSVGFIIMYGLNLKHMH